MLIYTDAEGSGGRAALIFDALSETREACLIKYGVPEDEEAQAAGIDLISTLHLLTVVSALWPLNCAPAGASVFVFVGSDSAAQAITEGGPNHLLNNHLVGAFSFG